MVFEVLLINRSRKNIISLTVYRSWRNRTLCIVDLRSSSRIKMLDTGWIYIYISTKLLMFQAKKFVQIEWVIQFSSEFFSSTTMFIGTTLKFLGELIRNPTWILPENTIAHPLQHISNIDNKSTENEIFN